MTEKIGNVSGEIARLRALLNTENDPDKYRELDYKLRSLLEGSNSRCNPKREQREQNRRRSGLDGRMR